MNQPAAAAPQYCDMLARIPHGDLGGCGESPRTRGGIKFREARPKLVAPAQAPGGRHVEEQARSLDESWPDTRPSDMITAVSPAILMDASRRA